MASQDFGDGHVRRRAVVGGASQRDLGVAETVGVGRTGFEQRQRLQGFDGRACINQPIDVTKRRNQTALTIDDGGKHRVLAFDDSAAPDFDIDGIAVRHRLGYG